jgi:hypothetical protein
MQQGSRADQPGWAGRGQENFWRWTEPVPPAVGIDVEWRSVRRKGQKERVAIFQLAFAAPAAPVVTDEGGRRRAGAGGGTDVNGGLEGGGGVEVEGGGGVEVIIFDMLKIVEALGGGSSNKEDSPEGASVDGEYDGEGGSGADLDSSLDVEDDENGEIRLETGAGAEVLEKEMGEAMREVLGLVGRQKFSESQCPGIFTERPGMFVL